MLLALSLAACGAPFTLAPQGDDAGPNVGEAATPEAAPGVPGPDAGAVDAAPEAMAPTVDAGPEVLATADAAVEACTPAACFAGHQCGLVADSCGGAHDCGECPAGDVCSAGVCASLATLGCLPAVPPPPPNDPCAGQLQAGNVCMHVAHNGGQLLGWYVCQSAAPLPSDTCRAGTNATYWTCCATPQDC